MRSISQSLSEAEGIVHGTASASKELAALHEMSATTVRDAQRLSQCSHATNCDKLSEEGKSWTNRSARDMMSEVRHKAMVPHCVLARCARWRQSASRRILLSSPSPW